MNIAFFLTPKSDVVWVSGSGTVEQALERMKPNGFGSVPILDDDGGYVGTLSTGDLMWHLMGADGTWQESARTTPLLSVRRQLDDSAVHIDADFRQLMARVVTQGFVSVVDVRGVFIGIVRRRPIIEYSPVWSNRSGQPRASVRFVARRRANCSLMVTVARPALDTSNWAHEPRTSRVTVAA